MSVSRRDFLRAASATVGVLALAGCGESSDEEEERISIGIINSDPAESGYRAANDRDIRETFTWEAGFAPEYAYSMEGTEQISSVSDLLRKGVKYLLVSAASVTGWEVPLRDAYDAGTQTILFDRPLDVDESLYAAAVVSDMDAEGQMAVDWLAGQGLERYDILHIQGLMGSAAQVGRTGALDAAVKGNDNWNLVVQQAAAWSSSIAEQITQAAIDSGKTFNVVYAENDEMARGAVAALDASGITHGRGGEVIVMGFDHNTWALEEVLAGNWNYDGQCVPYQASALLDIVTRLEAGEEIVQKTVYLEEGYVDCDTITQDYIDEHGI